jgi:protein-L-isoaspartate O-methyltransferase
VTPLDEFVSLLSDSLTDDTFVKLTLGKGRRDGLRQAFVRLVEIRGAPHISISLRSVNKDITENHRVDEAPEIIRRLLESSFGNAHLFTTDADAELLTNKKGAARLATHKPTFTEQLATDHDRPKRYVLDPALAPYLRELGLVSAEGKVKSDKADKYRQLQNLLKIFDELAAKSRLNERAGLRVVDMGCGKGYLTFALYDYCNNRLGVPTEVIGVDRNAELMEVCSGIAAKLGMERLRFECGDVAASEHREFDVLVALHACDTATDDAIFQGIEAGASIIIAVPCCQKELRPQFKAPAEEQPLFKHDTYKDRFSQMLTDAMRGLLLESQGYRTRISEFISDAHTHRNVMIAGVLDASFRGRDSKRNEILAMKQRYRVDHQRLETLLLASGRLANRE